MHRLIISALAAAALAGCAGTQTYNAVGQQYRPAGESRPVSITGNIDRHDNGIVQTGADLRVFFNGSEVLRGPLPPRYTGDISGGTWQGRAVSASCGSSPLTANSVQVRCIVFVDNERAATLVF